MTNYDWDSRKLSGIEAIEDIVGKTPVQINVDSDLIEFIFSDNTACEFFHIQDCCECVDIEDVNGDWSDLLYTPLLVAEERECDFPPLYEYEDSYTWTFYTFRSVKGSVDVRWYGTSNGYYSESVDFQGGMLVE